MEIYEELGQYFGKIIWFSPPQDLKIFSAKDKDLINGKINDVMGKDIIMDLEFDGNQWVNGKIYEIRKNRLLDCSIDISDNNNELFITISKGSFFSKQVTWTKIFK